MSLFCALAARHPPKGGTRSATGPVAGTGGRRGIADGAEAPSYRTCTLHTAHVQSAGLAGQRVHLRYLLSSSISGILSYSHTACSCRSTVCTIGELLAGCQVR